MEASWEIFQHLQMIIAQVNKLTTTSWETLSQNHPAKLCTFECKFLRTNVSIVVQSLSRSNCWWPHRLQQARLPCPLPSPGVCTNSCPLSQWCHPAISSSVSPFSPCPQSFPAAGSFPMSQLFLSGGQSTGASASASILPMNIQSWFPSGLNVLIFLLSKRFSRVFSRTKVRKHQFFSSISLEYMLRGRKVGPYLRCLFNFLNFSKTSYTNSISTGSV